MLLVLVASACSDGSVVAPGGGSGGPPADAWVWQNVAPFANDFIALESLGSGEAIALTRHDGLMTRDGGNSWQELPLDEFFYDIHRRGDLVSILTGGRVQLSTDRGGSWRSTAPHSVGRRAAAFWDENNGIVVWHRRYRDDGRRRRDLDGAFSRGVHSGAYSPRCRVSRRVDHLCRRHAGRVNRPRVAVRQRRRQLVACLNSERKRQY